MSTDPTPPELLPVFYQNASKMRPRIGSRGPRWTILSGFTTQLISLYVTRRKPCLLSGSMATDFGPSGNSTGHPQEVLWSYGLWSGTLG